MSHHITHINFPSFSLFFPDTKKKSKTLHFMYSCYLFSRKNQTQRYVYCYPLYGSTTMDTISSVQQRTPTKKTKPNKNNKKPIKVVYISNPMKINTSASKFRALVQELTGQYAESPPDPSRFQVSGGDDSSSGGENQLDYEKDDHALVVPPPVDREGQLPGGDFSSFENFEPFDDVFTPHDQMVENISAQIPASVFYESPLLGHHW